jgi:hypothetical protein
MIKNNVADGSGENSREANDINAQTEGLAYKNHAQKDKYGSQSV